MFFSFSVLSAEVCEMPDIYAFNKFNKFDHLNLDLKECLKKVQKDCEKVGENQNQLKLDKRVKKAFEKAKKTKAFREMYCTNYLNGEINMDWDRNCSKKDIDLQLEDFSQCSDFPVTADDDRVHTMCDDYVIEQMQVDLTPEIKNNYKKTIQKVISGFSELYKDKLEVQEILSQIAIDTNFKYRLNKMVAGQRVSTDPEMQYDCMWEEKKPEWCESPYIIVPGGYVFANQESMELVMSHEVGHVINDVLLNEPELRSKANQIKGCAHEGSSILNADNILGEGGADLHMAKYYHKFMKTKKSLTHFCHYPMDATFYLDSRHNHYLHPYHRQALINCYSEFK